LNQSPTEPRLPPGSSLEATPHGLALDHLVRGMHMVSACQRRAGEAYRAALKVAIVAAPYGPQGHAVERVLQEALKSVEIHLATVPVTEASSK
jgi:hypothetical protein